MTSATAPSDHIEPTCHLLNTADGARVALWELSPTQSCGEGSAVFLSHGAFSDKRICLGVARQLAGLGHRCFILEWRGHGASPAYDEPFTLETIALYDYRCAFEYLCHELGISQVHGVTHSGGGLCLTMFLVQYPEYQRHLASMTLVACQAFGAVTSYASELRLRCAKGLNRLWGHIPATLFGLGRTNESYHTMQAWFDWNLQKNFVSGLSALDYRQAMSAISVPVCAICAEGDRWIAPVSGCLAYLEAFGSTEKQLLLFGTVHGHLEDYSHGRIMLSRPASQEVWSRIADWITLHQSSQSSH